ncbi:MAG: hypothetical protein GC172_01150 [Phycisphaera sp.]|nr:hypothetical protein [Phycisphaera sp.]
MLPRSLASAIQVSAVLSALALLGACSGGSLVSSTIAPASHGADAWRGEPSRWFLESPWIEVREEKSGARRALVPTGGSAGAQDAGWRRTPGVDGAMSREVSDAPSGARVVEHATAVRAESGTLVLERTVEVIALPAGFELTMHLPLSKRGPSSRDAADRRRVDWTVHGAPLGALWGEESHFVVLGRDEATRITLRP